MNVDTSHTEKNSGEMKRKEKKIRKIHTAVSKVFLVRQLECVCKQMAVYLNGDEQIK